jgi:hypothetical protein
VRKFVVTLIVLAVLLVAADFGLRAYAESKTADAVATELETKAVPDVSIEGFPFIYHAIRGQYPQVIITATNLDDGLLPGISAVLTLSQVTEPLRDALAGDTSQLAAQATNLQVRVPLAALSAALDQPGLTLSAAPDGSLAVSTAVSVLGRQIPVTGTAKITVSNDTLTLAVGSLTAAGVDVTALATAAANTLASTLTKTFSLAGLPFSVTDAAVEVSGSDVVLTATTGPVKLADLK